METNHPNGQPGGDPLPALDPGAAGAGNRTAVIHYTLSTTLKPTVRLLNHTPAGPAHAGAARVESIRVGLLPNSTRRLRISPLTPPAEAGWTRPVAARPFVTRSFSGVRIRSGEPPLPVRDAAAAEAPDSSAEEEQPARLA